MSGRFVSERRRVGTCAAAGAIVGGGAAVVTDWELAVLLGWITAAGAFLIWVWSEIGHLDAVGTANVATREDGSRTVARIAVVVASIASLAAVVVGLHRAAVSSVELEIAMTTASMATVMSSWLVAHTVFVLRYAHLFYGGDRPGGIGFPGGDAPTYHDFAYLGFTVGMTFQVSDTEIDDPAVRATVLRHALISYVFGTAIIASTINVLAGLVG